MNKIQALMKKYDEIRTFVSLLIWDFKYDIFKTEVIFDIISNRESLYWNRLPKYAYLNTIEKLGITRAKLKEYISHRFCDYLTEDELDYFISSGKHVEGIVAYILDKLDLHELSDIVLEIWQKMDESEKEFYIDDYFANHYFYKVADYLSEIDNYTFAATLEETNKLQDFVNLLETLYNQTKDELIKEYLDYLTN